MVALIIITFYFFLFFFFFLLHLVRLLLTRIVKYDHSVNKLPRLDMLFLISIQADQAQLQRIAKYAADTVSGKY